MAIPYRRLTLSPDCAMDLASTFPLRALFEDPTVAGLAARIAVLQAKRSHPEQLAEVLTSLESCPDEEAELLLSQENSKAI